MTRILNSIEGLRANMQTAVHSVDSDAKTRVAESDRGYRNVI